MYNQNIKILESCLRIEINQLYDYQEYPINQYSIVSDTRRILEKFGCLTIERKKVCQQYIDEELYGDDEKNIKAMKNFIKDLNLVKSGL